MAQNRHRNYVFNQSVNCQSTNTVNEFMNSNFNRRLAYILLRFWSMIFPAHGNILSHDTEIVTMHKFNCNLG